MIIFAVQTNIELSKKPEWLDAFRSKYGDLRYDYHVTLKQPWVISEKQIPEIREKLSSFFGQASVHPMHLTFNTIVLASTKVDQADGCIMIKSEDNEQINKLQENIVGVLSIYKEYVEPESKEYEEQFMPHITIAWNLDAEKFKLAEKELKQDYFCEGEVTKVILSIIRNFDHKDKSKGVHNDSEYILTK